MRRAGILLPVFSLPSPFGVGTLGRAAGEFVDFLAEAGQSCWQLLPVGQTGCGDSPYQALSSWAGNPYFIDLGLLAEDGLLRPEEYRDLPWGDDPARVDYGLLYRSRFGVLRTACGRLEDREGFARFCRDSADWLEDYALYMALKGKNGGGSWLRWPREERLRRPEALDRAREELGEDIAFWKKVQYLFFRQWDALRDCAHSRGIALVGDLPIYSAADSADVWAHPEQFLLDGDGRPAALAGCPPDGFSPDGQLWGNPLFDWERMEKDGYRWWIGRLAFQFRLFDVLRLDHFRGFDAYYAVPAGEETARNGQWRPGPGLPLFEEARKVLGERKIIAEDLGFLTPSVHQLLQDTGFPGMKVLQFAFDDPAGPDLPDRCGAGCVLYPGTHDNDTLAGWLENGPPESVARAKQYLRSREGGTGCREALRAVWGSGAGLTVVQLQDILGLGSAARMNTPSRAEGNWRWRALPGCCTPELAARLRRETEACGRLPGKSGRERWK